MQLAIIGTGYVGLISGVCLSELGHRIVCIDNAIGKVGQLQLGEMPIYEPGLKELCAKNLAAGRLSFTADLAAALQGCDMVMVAVGTPSTPSGEADLGYIDRAVDQLMKVMPKDGLMVIKSTVPIGTNRAIAQRIKASGRGDIEVVSNPEFLREGKAICDFLEPDRVIVGAESAHAKAAMERLYQPLVERGYPLLLTGLETAETIKYAANAFLATKVAFINQIADVCEASGADVEEVSYAIGLDKRIGSGFLKPGPGYGGSCFPKDTRALAWTARRIGRPIGIVESVIEENEVRKQQMADKVIEACGGSVEGLKIAVLGVAFKGGTDDTRESPALVIVPRLQKLGARIVAYDPAAMEMASTQLRGVNWARDCMSALNGADAALILTEWEDFAQLDLHKVAAALRHPLLIDLRNLFAPDSVAEAGLDYVSIGRTTVRTAAPAD
ncbi:MAG: UDP-glucose/GDP-mannose dehydrogenase family protein [Rhodospirillales bacterium]|nr:UDP-glucose/GDP-mannose dehydrogenase family protein [Rhodospirillales bacterium]